MREELNTAVSETPPEAGPMETVLDWEDPSSLPVDAVQDLFLTLSKALRSYQLYDRNNPVYRKFVGSLREAFTRVWESRAELQILVEEDRFLWMGEEVYREEQRTGSLAFLVYRDGIRDLTLRRGLEEDEMEVLLDVLHRVRSARQEEDDLVTLLWDLDLEHVSYTAVDLLPEGTLLRADRQDDTSDLDVGQILEGELGLDEIPDVGEEGEAVEATVPDALRSIRPEDFNPATYALDPREQSYLEEAFRNELERDLRGDVLNGLFDRLEDPDATTGRQVEIVSVLGHLLPTLLAQGHLRDAARLLRQLEDVANRRDRDLAPEALAGVEELLGDFSSPESVRELVRALEEGAVRTDPQDLGLLLRHLRPAALGPLLARAEEIADPEARQSVYGAMRVLAEGEEGRVLRYLAHDDPTVVAGAVRLMAALKHKPAAPRLARLLEDGPPKVKEAVLQAARRIPASPLAEALERALTGEDRNLRVGAARVLSEIRYTPAERTFRAVLEDRFIREADLAEQMAFFSGYADLAGDDAVSLLDRTLNHRSFLGRREPAEARACAALALGRIRSVKAIEALERSLEDDELVVRTAVRRALAGGQEESDG